jgi:hypothetical protein
MESELALAPESISDPSTVMEEQIQILTTCGLLKHKADVGWGPLAGETFPTEGTGETVTFPAHIEPGFGVPTGDFFHMLLYLYQIDLVRLVANAITIVSSFIHLCEAYLGILPHFHLWQYFFERKKMRKSEAVGSVEFMLHCCMKLVYINLMLPDNTTDWKQGWFYLDNSMSALPMRSGYVPVPGPEWSN